jgi:hypothetical protein
MRLLNLPAVSTAEPRYIAIPAARPAGTRTPRAQGPDRETQKPSLVFFSPDQLNFKCDFICIAFSSTITQNVKKTTITYYADAPPAANTIK